MIGDFVNGGVESVIANYFSHMDLDKFEVHIIGHGIRVQECADRFAKMGFVLHNITPKRKSFYKNLIEMSEIFKKEKFDIVHSHLTEWACVPMILAWKCGVKIRINHSHMAEKPEGLKNIIFYGVRLWLGKIFATDYFACGEDAGRYLFGDRLFDSGKVKVIHNAIDLQRFKFDSSVREKMRKKLGIDESTTVIGHVGRFFEQKNHVFLIDIFEKYKKINPNSILLLLGDGELRENIEEIVRNKGLNDSILFLGVKKNVSEWYQVMDAFLLPSLYEGLPVVGVEAQASGLTCFFSDTITHEIGISPFSTFIPLSDTAEQWANIISNNIDNHDRSKVVLDSLYDIDVCAKKLEEQYMSMTCSGIEKNGTNKAKKIS